MSELMISTMPKVSRDLLTYEDYLTFPDNDGVRKEIIEGELFMSPAPSVKHQIVLRKLLVRIDNFVEYNKLGEVLCAPCDVIFSNITVMQPDILFISKENFQILTDLNIKGAPDLLVEILSPSSISTDRRFKKTIYERFGVKEYWIVDPENEMVEIWVSENRRFRLVQKAKNDQTVESQLLRGFQIQLSQIFKSF